MYLLLCVKPMDDEEARSEESFFIFIVRFRGDFGSLTWMLINTSN